MIGFSQEDYSTLETIKNTGGIVPDQHWRKNKEKILQAIELTAALNIKFLTFHFGFIENYDYELREKVRFLADVAEQNNIMIYSISFSCCFGFIILVTEIICVKIIIGFLEIIKSPHFFNYIVYIINI